MEINAFNEWSHFCLRASIRAQGKRYRLTVLIGWRCLSHFLFEKQPLGHCMFSRVQSLCICVGVWVRRCRHCWCWVALWTDYTGYHLSAFISAWHLHLFRSLFVVDPPVVTSYMQDTRLRHVTTSWLATLSVCGMYCTCLGMSGCEWAFRLRTVRSNTI